MYTPEPDDDYLEPEHDKPFREPPRPGGRGGRPPAPPPSSGGGPKGPSAGPGARRPPPPLPAEESRPPPPPTRDRESPRAPPPVPQASVTRKQSGIVPPTPGRVGRTVPHKAQEQSRPPPAVPGRQPTKVEPNNNVEEEQDTYGEIQEENMEPLNTAPKKTPSWKKPKPVLQIAHVEETYEALPDEEYRQDEYSIADSPPIREDRPSFKAGPLPPVPSAGLSPPAVKEQGFRIGGTAVLDQIKSRPQLKKTTFDPKPEKNEGPQVIETSGGVKAMAKMLNNVLGGGSAAPARATPTFLTASKPLPPPPAQHLAPPPVASPRSTHVTDNGIDAGYESGAPVGDRISSLSTSSNSTSGSRDSCDSTRAPPALPPRSDMPLPPVPKIDGLAGEPWYRPDLGRDTANSAVLSAGGHGSFLIRDSKKSPNQPYTLVVLHQNNVKNIPIRKRDDNTYAFGKMKENEATFGSVKQMVEYHKSSAVLLDGGGSVTLQHPVKK